MYEYRAHIRSVHDADSLRADVDLGFGTWISNMALRLHGVDAPELGTAAGRAARDYLRHRLPTGTAVVIQTHRDAREKYGRMLAVVFLDDVDGDCINADLIANGHARPYDGGAR